MNSIMEEMINAYNATTLDERKNAVKEVIQEVVLCGLSRARFFDKAAFYGGTALRIFYGLDRFSEDLDFSLKQPDKNFDLSAYFPMLQKEVAAFGLDLKIEEKEKTMESNIKSAFFERQHFGTHADVLRKHRFLYRRKQEGTTENQI